MRFSSTNIKFTILVLALLGLTGLALNAGRRVSAQSTPTCATPPSGLVAWYRAEGNANDSQGSNNGTLQNGATFAAGKVGQAFSFDGSDDYVEVPDNAALNSTTATWAFWMRTTQSGVNAGIIGKHDANRSSANGVTIAVSTDGKLVVNLKGDDPANFAILGTANPIKDGQFHHVALSFQSGGTITLYVDGAVVSTTTAPSFTFAANSPLRIGRMTDPFWAAFNGLVDEVQIYSRVLSQTEIQSIFNADSAGNCSPSPSPTADLSVSLTPSTESPGVDREFTYTVKVKNNGPSAAEATVLEPRVPANTILVAEVPGCTRKSRNLTCPLGTVQSGAEPSIQIRLRPTAPGVNTMRADVSSSTSDPSAANNTAQKTLNVSDAPRPSNDNFSNAQALQGDNVTVIGANVNATAEVAYIPYDPNVGERFHAGRAASKSVWYVWISPAKRGRVTITTADSKFDTLLEVRQLLPGNDLRLQSVAKADDSDGLLTSSVTFQYVPETAYYIAVDGYGGATGEIKLTLSTTYFQDPGEYVVQQRVTGFNPQFACAENSDPDEIICGKKKDAQGLIVLRVFGQNFTSASKVFVDEKPITSGFYKDGTPATGYTEFVSSKELVAHLPPNPPLTIQKLDQITVRTPVTLNTGAAAKSGAQPDEVFSAVAHNIGLFNSLQLRNATIPPNGEGTVCGNTTLNKPGGETCVKFSNYTNEPTTVSLSWFAAVAYCDAGIPASKSAERQKCAVELAHGGTVGNQFAINPQSAKLPNTITVRERVDLPPGTTALSPGPIMAVEGGRLVGLDGSSLVGSDGSSLVAAGGLNLVGSDGSSLVAAGGLNLVGSDGSSLVAAGGGNLVGLDGASLFDNGGGKFCLGCSTYTSFNSPATEKGTAADGTPESGGVTALAARDVSKSSSGYFVARSSGGMEPTFTITTDEVTGETYGILEITLDETSTPRASNVKGLAFAVLMAPPVITLQTTTATVDEGAGSVTVKVLRTGDDSKEAYFDYATGPGTATERSDFTPLYGTLKFAAGEKEKSITIPIIDNNLTTGARNFNLFIGNPVGAAIQMPRATNITITDNDTAAATTNPLDGAQFFVRQHYLDFLSRLPDEGGLGYWSSQITDCGVSQKCVNDRRIGVSNAFFFELEYQQTGSYVFRLYRAAFGNNQPFPNPDTSDKTEAKKYPAYAVFAPDRARVVGGSGLAQSQLDLANKFVERPEFLAKYELGIEDAQFVDTLLANIKTDIGVDLSSQRAALISLANSEGRGAVLYRLADDNVSSNPINNRAFIDAEYNRAFVVTQYFGYLRRDADIGGLLFWLNQVNRFPLRSTGIQNAMVCSFITSAEYQTRFSSVVTHSNHECPQ